MVIENDTARRIYALGKEGIFLRHLFILVGNNLEVEELRKNNQEHPTKDESYDITSRLIKNRHFRIWIIN